jgi:hypothetical protein
MSIIHVQQIGANIRERFTPLIDMSDVKTTDLEQRDMQLVSRSLASSASVPCGPSAPIAKIYGIVTVIRFDGALSTPLESTDFIT